MLLTALDERCQSSCGNKAANLGRLARLGFQVPEGLVLSIREYDEFLRENGLHDIIAERIQYFDTVDAGSLMTIATFLRARFEAAHFPAEQKESMMQWLRCVEGTFAVRSSAASEDLPNASFAGQYDSYLNVAAAQVPFFVKQCFASLFNARAMLYRRRKGIKGLGGMAVIIQQMLQSDFAGVMFTKAPHDSGRLMIECGPGLGDAIVSGKVRPNRYLVNRDTLVIDEAREVTDFDRQVVGKLAVCGLRIETILGAPQDVEFSIIQSGIHVLQSRPVTHCWSSHGN